MASLIETIMKTQTAMDAMQDDKKPAVIALLVQLTRRFAENVMPLAGIADHYQAQLLPELQAQLQAAEKRTEHAADEIMTIGEALMKAMGQYQGADKAELQKHVNKLFEAVSFQDLVAQHLTAIQLQLNELTDDMQAMQDIFNALADSDSGPARKPRGRRADAHLLNGPTTQVAGAR